MEPPRRKDFFPDKTFPERDSKNVNLPGEKKEVPPFSQGEEKALICPEEKVPKKVFLKQEKDEIAEWG